MNEFKYPPIVIMIKKNEISDHVLPISMKWQRHMPGATCGTSSINGHVAVSQLKIMVMLEKK